MTEIALLPEEHYAAFADIIARAYPTSHLNTQEAKERFIGVVGKMQDQDPIATAYGAYRDGRLLGGMILYDFQMQFGQTRLGVGGVGSVAVDLIHKKEKIARDMIQYFIERYARKDVGLLTLYPFRPDFYRQMGFGYGTQKHRYHVLPAALPAGTSRAHLRFLSEDDQDAVMACYNRYMKTRHGLLTRRPVEFERLLDIKNTAVGYWDGATLRGYLITRFEEPSQSNTFSYDLTVREIVAPDREVLGEFFAYLHTQADQVGRIAFYTQDDGFYHLLSDPRDGTDALLPPVYHQTNVSGIGLMYRVTSVPQVFKALAGHDFGGQSLTLRITLTDSFYPSNAASHVIRFEGGRASLQPTANADAEIRLNVAEFSSLLVGAIDFRQLYDYGLVDLSDPAHVAALDALFRTPRKPICYTSF